MIGWFHKWYTNKYLKDQLVESSPQTAVVGRGGGIDQQGINFTMYRASGGYVIEVRSYDRRTDRSFNNLHIINEDAVMAEELAKIITLETLRS